MRRSKDFRKDLHLIEPQDIEVTRKTLRNLRETFKEAKLINQSNNESCLKSINHNLKNIGKSIGTVPKDFGAKKTEIKAKRFFKFANIMKRNNEENGEKQTTEVEQEKEPSLEEQNSQFTEFTNGKAVSIFEQTDSEEEFEEESGEEFEEVEESNETNCTKKLEAQRNSSVEEPEKKEESNETNCTKKSEAQRNSSVEESEKKEESNETDCTKKSETQQNSSFEEPVDENTSYDKLNASKKQSIYQSCKKKLCDVFKTPKKGFFKNFVNPLKKISTKVYTSVKDKLKPEKKVQIFDNKKSELGPEATKMIEDEYMCRIVCQLLEYLRIWHMGTVGIFRLGGETNSAETFVLDVKKKMKNLLERISSQIVCSENLNRAEYSQKYEEIDDDFRENVSKLIGNTTISRYLLSKKELESISAHTLVLVINRIISQNFGWLLDPQMVDSLQEYVKQDPNKSTNSQKKQSKKEFKDIQQLFINSIEPKRRKILSCLFDTVNFIDKNHMNSQMDVKAMITCLTTHFYPFENLKEPKKQLFDGLSCAKRKKPLKDLKEKLKFVNGLANELYDVHLGDSLLNY